MDRARDEAEQVDRDVLSGRTRRPATPAGCGHGQVAAQGELHAARGRSAGRPTSGQPPTTAGRSRSRPGWPPPRSQRLDEVLDEPPVGPPGAASIGRRHPPGSPARPDQHEPARQVERVGSAGSEDRDVRGHGVGDDRPSADRIAFSQRSDVSPRGTTNRSVRPSRSRRNASRNGRRRVRGSSPPRSATPRPPFRPPPPRCARRPPRAPSGDPPSGRRPRLDRGRQPNGSTAAKAGELLPGAVALDRASRSFSSSLRTSAATAARSAASHASASATDAVQAPPRRAGSSSGPQRGDRVEQPGIVAANARPSCPGRCSTPERARLQWPDPPSRGRGRRRLHPPPARPRRSTGTSPAARRRSSSRTRWSRPGRRPPPSRGPGSPCAATASARA